jgi:hypothetical protein
MKKLLMLLLLIPACGGSPDQSPNPAAPAMSCELLDATSTEQVFRFSDVNTSSVDAGLGTECVSLGGGVFDCKPEACLVLPYTGTCPHCGGGGE